MTTHRRTPAAWLVIADDLSGAADCAIGFAAAGARTMVTLDATAADDALAGIADADVIAADVDSRRMAPALAAASNVAAWRRLGGTPADRPRRLYKKIDSTLRGNWAAETAALLPHAGVAIVAPAFPATGRTTRGGCVFVNGEPLGESDIWRLEGLSGRADMAALLAVHDVRTAVVDLDVVHQGAQAVQATIAAFVAKGVQAVVCDAESEADIGVIAAATGSLKNPVFWVGSGGLARALATAVPTGEDDRSAGDVTEHRKGPVLALVGSMSGVSGRQAALLRTRTGMDHLEIAPQVLREGPAHASWPSIQEDIGQRLRGGHDLLIGIGRDEAFDTSEGPKLSHALATLVLPSFDCVGGLIATGGETARAMLAAAGIATLRLRHEVEAGVPLSRTLERPARHVATKAGAFGTDSALWLAWRAMQAE
ncbi:MULTISPECIES: four-carbon acid sugar kinase family protein [unclassified Cupriavidus]|uniref:four-carbon acid sugar kinase family protein n=1 Tax=unclassified Cupriavidus TaxID=2640874 RepID=UPI00313C9D00